MRIKLAICLLATCQASRSDPLQVDHSSNAEVPYEFDTLLFGEVDPYDDEELDEVDLSDDEGLYTWRDVPSPKATRKSPPIPIPGRDTPVSMSSRHAVADSYDPAVIAFKKRVESPTRIAQLAQIIKDSSTIQDLEMNYIKAINMLDFDFEDVYRGLEEQLINTMGSGMTQSRDFAYLEQEYAQRKGVLESVYRTKKVSFK